MGGALAAGWLAGGCVVVGRARQWSVVDFGARPDGKTDSTRAIQRALDAVKDEGGGTLVFPTGDSFYRVDGTLRIRDASRLTLRGDRHAPPMLRQTAANAILMRLDQSTSCSIEGLWLQGRGLSEPNLYAPTTYAPALYVVGCEEIRITRCVVEHATSNGIDGLNSSNCLVENNECRDTALYNGIGWAGGTGNRFLANRLHHNRGQGMEIRSQTGFIAADNRSWKNGDPSFNQSAGITVEAENGRVNVNEVALEERVVVTAERPHLKKTGDLVTISGARGTTFLNGTHRITTIDSVAFVVEDVPRSGHYLGGATLILPVDQHLAGESSRGLLERNICSDNNGYGIYIVASNNARTHDIDLRSNVCTDNAMIGILCATGVSTQHFRDCSNIRIDDCTVTGSGGAGVVLYFCNDVTLRRNRVFANRAAGFDAQASVVTRFENNCVRGNHPEFSGFVPPSENVGDCK